MLQKSGNDHAAVKNRAAPAASLQWQKLGGDFYSISFTHYFLDGEDVGEAKVTATAELSADRQEFHGNYLTEISVGGMLVDRVEGSVAASRQSVRAAVSFMA